MTSPRNWRFFHQQIRRSVAGGVSHVERPCPPSAARYRSGKVSWAPESHRRTAVRPVSRHRDDIVAPVCERRCLWAP